MLRVDGGDGSVWRVELGAANREARMEAGLSQAGLADELGVGQSSVSQWEHGTTAPATRHLLGLLQVLGALLVRLLLGEEASAAGGEGGGRRGELASRLRRGARDAP